MFGLNTATNLDTIFDRGREKGYNLSGKKYIYIVPPSPKDHHSVHFVNIVVFILKLLDHVN